MGKRIRYVSDRSDTDNALVSLRVFKAASGREYKVYLFPIDGKFTISDAISGESMLTGMGKSESNLKIKAKKALESLGVTFDQEVRTTQVSARLDDISTDV